MMQPSRKYSAGSKYRYGFNGKEKSDEVNGDGNIYDYGFRIYNPRVGRFLSVDPLTSSYPYYTPYQFAGNMTIAAVDLDGLEQYVVIYYKDEHKTTTSIQVRAITDNAGNVLNQHVHKVSDTKEKDIAKGNVLVFESYQQKNGYENMKIVDSRNQPESELTANELKIYNKHKKEEKERGKTQTLGYGGNPNGNPSQYVSQGFENADTKTFNSNVEIPMPKIDIVFEGKHIKENEEVSVPILFNGQSDKPITDDKTIGNIAKGIAGQIKNTSIKVIISGYVLLGSSPYNKISDWVTGGDFVGRRWSDLAKARAEKIKAALVKAGVKATQISTDVPPSGHTEQKATIIFKR